MKTIYIYLWALLLGSMTTAYSQSQEDPQASSLLPNIVPPSAESYKFVEYGKNQANEYTGKIGLAIPIYDYSAGQLKMPISLNYSGAGVKVEDMATWTGINWNLSVGGVITRQIKDAPDEHSDRVIVNETHLKNNAHDLCAPNSEYYWALARTDEFKDTEFDIFNFSFMGYSGSFYLDANFNPVYLENENEIKINILGSHPTDNRINLGTDKTFMITTPDGKKFYFGGQYTESTMVLSGSHSINSDGVTSFFLYKIEDPVNGTILLEYDTISAKVQKLSKSYSMSTFIASPVSGEMAIKTVKLPTESIFKNRIIDPRRLKKIKSLNTTIEVVFNRSDYTNLNFSSVLNSIEVINTVSPSVPLQKIDFTYLAKTSPEQSSNDFTTAYRFFLTQVEFNKHLDNTNHKYEKYVLDYDDPAGLPDRMSNSRDALGYYNGATNASLLPKHHNYVFNNNAYFGNLNPSFAHGKKGSLVKVIYPTKGYSTFEYEAVPSKNKVNKSYNLGVNSYSGNEFGIPLVYQIPGNMPDFNGEVVYVNAPNVYVDQDITFTVNLGLGEQHSNSTALSGKGVEFIIKDVTANTETVYTTTFPKPSVLPVYTYNLKKDHSYTFKLQFKDNYTTSGTYQSLEGSVNFNVFEGYSEIEGLGIRLKRDTNYNHDGSITNQKRYYYGRINGEYSNLALQKDVFFNPKIVFTDGGNEEVGLGATSIKLNGVFSSDIVTNSNKPIADSYEKYNTVSISLGGDLFEKGGIEKTFLNISENYGGVQRILCVSDGCRIEEGEVVCGPPSSYGNMAVIRNNFSTPEKSTNNYYNGKLLCERSYVNKSGQLYKLNETVSEYKLTENGKVTNFIGREIFDDMVTSQFCLETPNDLRAAISSCFFGYNTIKARSFNLDKTYKREYITPVPLSDYVKFDANDYSLAFLGDIEQGLIEEIPLVQETVEASYKKIVTTQTYEYGTLRGMPTKVTTTNSDGTVQNSESVYVNQYGTLTGLTSNQTAAYAALLSQNNVASPIETKQTEGTSPSILLGKKRTTYQVLSGNKVVPEKVCTAKGVQSLEERAVFEEYDSKGNPTLMSLTGGVKIKYLYNANNQVIAKIENFTGTLDPNTNNIAVPCDFIDSYPNAQVSVFEYQPITNLLVKMYDTNCKETIYVYDNLHRLMQIKERTRNGVENIIKAFDQNFKH